MPSSFIHYYSQYILIFESNRGMYQLDNDRTYALVLKTDMPKYLNVNHYSDIFSQQYEVKFYLALLVKIDLDEDIDHKKQYLKLRNFFSIKLKEHLLNSQIEGVWSLPKDEIKRIIFKHFESNSYNIVSTQGIWQEEFDAAIQNKP